MTRKQAERLVWLSKALEAHGLGHVEINQLLRAERTLHRWAERECGDGSDWAIERDDETGKPMNVYHGQGARRAYPIADREAGALRRVKAICDRHGLGFFHQGDPRGCALYVLRPGDVPRGEPTDAYYTRGIAICLD